MNDWPVFPEYSTSHGRPGVFSQVENLCVMTHDRGELGCFQEETITKHQPKIRYGQPTQRQWKCIVWVFVIRLSPHRRLLGKYCAYSSTRTQLRFAVPEIYDIQICESLGWSLDLLSYLLSSQYYHIIFKYFLFAFGYYLRKYMVWKLLIKAINIGPVPRLYCLFLSCFAFCVFLLYSKSESDTHTHTHILDSVPIGHYRVLSKKRSLCYIGSH